VRRIDADAAREFIASNHRFGWSKARYCYGLFVDRPGHDGTFSEGELVAVSCFSNARRWKKGERVHCSYEWVRYASLCGVRVAGGMSKMLRAFIDEVHPDDVMSYAPLDGGSEGEVYPALGFIFEGIKEFPQGRSAKYRLLLQGKE